MFQAITMWNLARPDLEQEGSPEITLRGYSSDTFLTGEFARKITDSEIKSLSVSYIADKICPERRDLYFYKGINKPQNRAKKSTWGGKVGNFFEDHLHNIFKTNIKDENISYRYIRQKSKNEILKYKSNDNYERMVSIQDKEGDTDWLIQLMDTNTRMEFLQNIFSKRIISENDLKSRHFLTKARAELVPKVNEIGISKPSTPDFIIPKYNIIGDIKTGNVFKSYYQLTCAGYALAYENQSSNKKIKKDINWGVIYFFPTRNHSAYVKHITGAQIYVFKIDDSLRKWFISMRNEAYNIISSKDTPKFPEDKSSCMGCKFKSYCISDGLILNE